MFERFLGKKFLVGLVVVGLMIPGLGSAAALDTGNIQALKAQVESLLRQVEILTAQISQIKSGVVLQPVSSGSSFGATVRATDSLRVRTQAGGEIVGTVPAGTTGVVTGSGVSADGYAWTKVRYSNGLEGYSAQNWLSPLVPPVDDGGRNGTGVVYACGDIDANGVVNQSDVTAYSNYLFAGVTLASGVKTDFNGDGQPDALDLAVLVDHAYSNGAAPSCGGGNVLPQNFRPVTSANTCSDFNKDLKIDRTDIDLLSGFLFAGRSFPAGMTGDLNRSGFPDSLDLVVLTDYVYSNGAAPQCAPVVIPPTITVSSLNTCANYNQDSLIDISDVNVLSNYLFGGGTLPAGLSGDLNWDGNPDSIDLAVLADYVSGAGQAPMCSVPLINITSPTVGQRWRAGAVQGFVWSGGNPNQQVMVAVETAPGQFFFPAGQALSNFAGGYNWNIPTNFTPGNYRVALMAPDSTPSVSDNRLLSGWRSFSIQPPVALAPIEPPSYSYTCGDIDANGVVNQSDITAFSNYLFAGAILRLGVKTDFNGDGFPDALDLAKLIDYATGVSPSLSCSVGTNSAYVPTGN